MDRTDVTAKAEDLMLPVIGQPRTNELIDSVWNIERIDDIRALRPLLQA